MSRSIATRNARSSPTSANACRRSGGASLNPPSIPRTLLSRCSTRARVMPASEVARTCSRRTRARAVSPAATC